MKKIISVFCVLSVIGLIASSASAESTGAAFLKIGTGARAVGMGSAYTAIANDATGMLWNPGGISQIKRPEFALLYTQWIVDTNYNYVGYLQPMKFGNLGLSIINLSQGTLEQRDENRNLTGTFSANDLAVGVTYSRAINLQNSLGVNLKFIQQNIATDYANGIAVDIGYLYKPTHVFTYPLNNLSLGLTLQNIGTPMKFINQSYSLPLTCAVGIGYNLFDAITLAADIKYQPIDNKVNFAVGSEYLFMNVVALRAGYLAKAVSLLTNMTDNGLPMTNDKALNIDTGLSAGLGLKIGNYQADYSFVPYGELGNTHRFSLSARF